MFKLQLDDGSIIEVYGYNEVADYLYSNKLNYILFEGRLDNNMMVEILRIENLEFAFY